MEAMTLPRQLLVTVDGGVNLANVRRAITMLKGVTKVKAQKVKAASKREQSQACLSSAERKQARTEFKPRLYDPETGEYLNDKTMQVIEDALKGKNVTSYASADDMFRKLGINV
jgi:DNA-binding transcriptional regulator YhcF (GntR family)